MIGWQPFSLIFQDKGHKQGITRSPDAPFAIKISFKALLNLSAPYIKTPQRQRAAVIQFKITPLPAFARNEQKGFSSFLKPRHAFPVGPATHPHLLLLVKQPQSNSLPRLGGSDNRECHQHDL